eukprot:scaffold45220_cov69-Phaeocystis_antarctica.AAC.3
MVGRDLVGVRRKRKHIARRLHRGEARARDQDGLVRVRVGVRVGVGVRVRVEAWVRVGVWVRVWVRVGVWVRVRVRARLTCAPGKHSMAEPMAVSSCSTWLGVRVKG